jgi:hypothetical protein
VTGDFLKDEDEAADLRKVFGGGPRQIVRDVWGNEVKVEKRRQRA